MQSKCPSNEILEQLIREHKGYELRMIKALEARGIKVWPTTFSRWINKDRGLRELIVAVRRARKEEENEAQKQAIRQAKQAEETFSLQDKKIPLSEEEVEVLSVYQEGDSSQALASKLGKPGGRVDILIASILLKKHAATLGEAKEKFIVSS